MKLIVDENLLSFKVLEQKIFDYVCELGRQITQQILEAADGKDSTALDSTIETSTTAPRSAEQIMEQMKEEEKAKKESSMNIFWSRSIKQNSKILPSVF